MKKRSGLYIFTIISLVAMLLAPITARAAMDDSYTVSFLHMDGANNSTSFIDESGKTWTAQGSAKLTTSYFEFGGASGIFSGSGDSVQTSANSDFDFGSGDFTVDFWMNPSNVSAFQYIMGQGDPTEDNSKISFYIGILNGAVFGAIESGSKDYNNYISSATVPQNTWSHIALIRSGNSLMIAVNGSIKQTSRCFGSICKQ